MASPHKRLPLASISIARPCPLPAAGREAEVPRQGDSRPCPACNKQVHNLSAVTVTEVDRLLADHERSGTMGALCIRYEADANGRPVPTACLRPRRAPLFTRVALVALVVVTGASEVAALGDALDIAYARDHRDDGEALLPRAPVVKSAPVRHLGGCPPGDPMCD